MTPYSPHHHSNPTAIIDVFAEGEPAALSVGWPATGPSTRPIDDEVDRLLQQLQAVHATELDQDHAQIPVTRQDLGSTLWHLLDGPERRLTRAMAAADARGEPLDLTIRLRTAPGTPASAAHPAATWRWELLSPPTGGHPTSIGRIRLAVQMGDVTPASAARTLEHGGLRIMFMAYSPRGVHPLLSYEREEERLRQALRRPCRERRAQLDVIEDGTLSELERRLSEEEIDVVHLSGHGCITPDGPRLLMEDALGFEDAVSPQRLLRALKRAAKRPDLILISSCHSADGAPSFAAALVAGGMPTVLGWTQPIRDDIATTAAADLYGRLCGGATPTEAVAFAREQMHDTEQHAATPSHSWGTLHLLMKDARGIRLRTDGTSLPRATMGVDALYRHLSVAGGMRVLDQGFRGRRRELQRLLRILRDGRAADRTPVAGALVVGQPLAGKSCLVGRALERHLQCDRTAGIVVLHGPLDDVTVVDRFTDLAVRRADDQAEAILLRDEPVPQRLRRLLTAHWADQPIVVVLDDFEHNLEPREGVDAQPSAYVAALLEVLMPACQANRPALLVTTTMDFAKPTGQEHSLVKVLVTPLASPL